MLGNFPENSFDRQDFGYEIEVDLESRRPHRNTNQMGKNLYHFSTLMLAKTGESLRKQVKQLTLKFIPHVHKN